MFKGKKIFVKDYFQTVVTVRMPQASSFFLQSSHGFSPNLSTLSLKTFKYMPRLLKLVIFLIAGSSPSSHSITTFLAISFFWSTQKITTWWIFSRLPSSFSSLVVFFFYFIKPNLHVLAFSTVGVLTGLSLSYSTESFPFKSLSKSVISGHCSAFDPKLDASIGLLYSSMFDLQNPAVLSDCFVLLSMPLYLWFQVLV